MNTDKFRSLMSNAIENGKLKHGEITDAIIGVFYDVYNELGYGFLESVYREAMIVALRSKNLAVEREKSVEVFFRGVSIGHFRTDLVVGNCVIVELKSARTLDGSHEAQLLNYLKATELEVGLLLNFGPRPNFRRMILDNDRKSLREKLPESTAPQET
jgi:GxxExxY protein